MQKAKHFFMAGRSTLAKAVLEAILTYLMMSNMVPKSCIKVIHQIQRQFIWGDIEGKNNLHMFNWDKITKLKQEDDLGLRKLTQMNKACLAKLG